MSVKLELYFLYVNYFFNSDFVFTQELNESIISFQEARVISCSNLYQIYWK